MGPEVLFGPLHGWPGEPWTLLIYLTVELRLGGQDQKRGTGVLDLAHRQLGPGELASPAGLSPDEVEKMAKALSRRRLQIQMPAVEEIVIVLVRGESPGCAVDPLFLECGHKQTGRGSDSKIQIGVRVQDVSRGGVETGALVPAPEGARVALTGTVMAA